LFLISDYEGGKCYTKKLTMKKLMTVMANNPSLISAILSDEIVDEEITEKVDTKVQEALDIQIINGGDAADA